MVMWFQGHSSCSGVLRAAAAAFVMLGRRQLYLSVLTLLRYVPRRTPSVSFADYVDNGLTMVIFVAAVIASWVMGEVHLSKLFLKPVTHQ